MPIDSNHSCLPALAAARSNTERQARLATLATGDIAREQEVSGVKTRIILLPSCHVSWPSCTVWLVTVTHLCTEQHGLASERRPGTHVMHGWLQALSRAKVALQIPETNGRIPQENDSATAQRDHAPLQSLHNVRVHSVFEIGSQEFLQ